MTDARDPTPPLTGEILPGRGRVRIVRVTGWPVHLIAALVAVALLAWFLVLPVIGLLTVLGWLL